MQTRIPCDTASMGEQEIGKRVLKLLPSSNEGTVCQACTNAAFAETLVNTRTPILLLLRKRRSMQVKKRSVLSPGSALISTLFGAYALRCVSSARNTSCASGERLSGNGWEMRRDGI